MKNVLKRLFGIDRLEQEVQSSIERAKQAEEKLNELQVLLEQKPLTPKEQATLNKEPFVTVLDIEVDPNAPERGAMELDWNEYFVLQLREHGYSGKTDEEVVDQWFTRVCSNVGLDTWEGYSNPGAQVTKTHLGNGRAEIG